MACLAAVDSFRPRLPGIYNAAQLVMAVYVGLDKFTVTAVELLRMEACADLHNAMKP